MILKGRYRGQDKDGESTDFNPYFGTDVGICSIIKPQLSFNKSLDHLPFWRKLFQANDNILAGSEVGKANGLTVLLDAETYDYTYHLRAGEGFKVNKYRSLNRALVVPLISGTRSVPRSLLKKGTRSVLRSRFEKKNAFRSSFLSKGTVVPFPFL